jgi:hypothetical protein
MPPPGVLPAAAAVEAVEGGAFAVDQQEGLVEDAADEEEDALASVRRAGPAMPPAEWLAAAAQMEYPVSEEDDEGLEGRQGVHDTGVGVDDDGGDFMVGPPPPEMAEELDLGEWMVCQLCCAVLRYALVLCCGMRCVHSARWCTLLPGRCSPGAWQLASRL